MAKADELRLMTKVSRLYYQQDLSQSQIARQLGLSQATISRLLQGARNEGIVRITVSAPNNVHTDLEEELAKKFQLNDVVVVDCPNDADEKFIIREIGSAAAFYIESSIKNNDVVGISSWSETLLALVDSMHQLPGKKGVKVVQILGGVGNPSAEVHANRLTGRFASLAGATPYFLPAPGIVGSEESLKVILDDQYVQEAMDLFEEVSIALVGIGDVEPSKMLSMSGNIFTDEEQFLLSQNGAVGDICLRFFNAHGELVKGPLDNRVVSMTLEQLRKVKRSIAVAGAERKYLAILGALRGQWINTLITDRCTAERLVQEE
jgi:DNA-binding transcriptional regulator LsrR (DeoR family)